MDLKDSQQEAAFRDEVRQWLDKNAKRREGQAASLRPAYRGAQQRPISEQLKEARAWQTKKAKAGYAAITWPKEFGGLGGTPMQRIIYQQEESKYEVPGGFFEIGLGMCIPTLMTHGTKEDKERYVRPALYGEEVWCQLFSEPGGGSDVAASRTRAVRDGDEWVINGQKVWTSGAHFSDYGIIVVRTDPDLKKHEGLSFFYLDMKTPGIEVKPIRQISGGSNFNEVFFTDVRVPHSQMLGEEGEGWKVALTTLMNERLAVGMGGGADWPELLQLARNHSLNGKPALAHDYVRQKIADWYTQTRGLQNVRMRTYTALSQGQTPGPENSIIKVVSAAKMQDLGAFAMEIEDMGGVMNEADESTDAAFQAQWVGSAGFRIAGGTDEILRNIIAERVLGLPPDMRADKNLPFKDIPSGK